MKQDNAISVVAARNLEEGDLFAYETSGRLASGLVTSVIYAGYQLDDFSRSYIQNNANLDIPEDPFQPLGGSRSSLVIYRPMSWFNGSSNNFEHIFLAHSHNVVVFAYNRLARAFTEVPEGTE